MRKLLIVLLSLCLLLSAAGCAGDSAPSGDPAAASASPEPTETTAPDEGEAVDIDALLSAAWEKYPLDTVVLTVGDAAVTWGEYYYWIAYQLADFYNYVGTLPVWEDETGAGSTYDEALKQYAEETVAYFTMFQIKAEELGVALSENSQAEIETAWQSLLDSTGSEEAAAEYLQGQYMTREVYDHFNQLIYLYYDIYEELYGEQGAMLGDDEVLATAADLGMVRAKHILYKTVNDSLEPLSEEEIAAARAAADAAVADMQGLTGEALQAAFDERMTADSEDGGIQMYPDGYVYESGYGQMVPEFETAVEALAEGEMSGIVESVYGLHIILRLPLGAEDTVEYDNYYQPVSLRYYIASSLFETSVSAWHEEIEPAYTEAFRDFRVSSLF